MNTLQQVTYVYNLVGFFFSLSLNRANLACAVIRDTVSDHLLVISACGVTSSGISDNIVEQWDLTTWDTAVLPYTCPPGVEYFDSGTYYNLDCPVPSNRFPVLSVFCQPNILTIPWCRVQMRIVFAPYIIVNVP